MSIRFDASTDTVTGGGFSGGVATVTCWVYLSADGNTFSDVWQFNPGGSPQAALGSEADGTTFEAYDSSFNPLGATALAVGTWYATAVVMNGTSWTFYRGTDPRALTSTAGTRTAISTPSSIALGLGAFSGRIAHFRLWTGALSAAEVAAELNSASPVGATNLIRAHSFVSGTVLTPDSGSGGNLTAGGTATTTEADPPLPLYSPVVQARSDGVNASSTTSHAMTLPTGIVAGELLLIVFSAGANVACTLTAGWNNLGFVTDAAFTVTGGVFWKFATGSDALTVTTDINTQTSHIGLRISAAGTPTGSSSTGNSSNSDPPNHTPPGGAKDYLWVATRAGDQTTQATVAPAGYSNLTTRASSGNLGAATATAERTATAASENPSAFTSSAEQWVSWLVAVPPVPFPGPPRTHPVQRIRHLLVR